MPRYSRLLIGLLAAAGWSADRAPGSAPARSLVGVIASDSLACSPDEQRVDVPVSSTSAGSRPFETGERLEYSVSFGFLHVGSGAMQLTEDSVDGRRVWRSQFDVDGGFMSMSVHDTNTSWFDASNFNSVRFQQRLHEPRYHANRDTRILPDIPAYQPAGDTAKASVPNPLDEVSLVYLIRTLSLVPGQCYEFRRYFDPSGNPIVIHVLRREQLRVPAGTYSAIVLRPQIATGGIFSQHGRAEVWISDDSMRAVVQLKSKLAFGSINLYLKSATRSVTRR